MGYTIPNLGDLLDAYGRRITRLENASFVYANPDTNTDTTLIPLNFSATITFYDGPLNNQKFARIVWSWDAPPADPNDLTADPVDHYRFQATPGGPEPYASTTQTSATTTAMPINTSITGSIYVVTRSGRKGPVINLIANTSYTGTAPSQPSTPTVVPALKGVMVTWDGKQVNGTPMPGSVQYVNVHAVEGTAAQPSFTPSDSNKVGRIYPNTGYYIPTVATTTVSSGFPTITVRFVAYDSANQPSPASTAGSSVPKKAQAGDVEEINAGVITVGLMSGSRIEAGTITGTILSGDAIDGKVITGATLRTAASGQRLELNSISGLRGWDSSLNRNLQITTAGIITAKSATLDGTFQTASSGARILIFGTAGNPGSSQIYFYSGSSAETSPAFIMSQVADGARTDASLFISAPKKNGYDSANLTLFSRDANTGADWNAQIYNGTYYWRGTTGYGGHRFIENGSPNNPWLTLYPSSGTDKTAFISADNGPMYLSASGKLDARSDQEIRLLTPATKDINIWAGGTLNLYADNYKVLYSNNTRIILPLIRTGTNVDTSLSPNIHATSGGWLKTTSSSKRFKVGIIDAQVPLDEIRSLRPVTYVDKGRFEENGNSEKGLRRAIGLIAEEVATLPTLGKYAVTYDDQGPRNVDYDRIAMLFPLWIRELEKRITLLEEK